MQNISPPSANEGKRGGEAGGLACKHLARMMGTVACSTVPRITLVVGNSFGAGAYVMSGRGTQPHFMFSWPSAHFSMDDSAASGGAASGERGKGDTGGSDGVGGGRNGGDGDDGGDSGDGSDSECDENNVRDWLHATSRQWDDGVIHPQVRP